VLSDLSRSLFSKFCVSASVLLLGGTLARGQDAPASVPPPPPESVMEVRALADSVRALQDQLRAVNSQLIELRAEQEGDRAETRALRSELDRTREPDAWTGGSKIADPSASQPTSSSMLSSSQQSPLPSDAAPQNATIDERIDKLEEDQQLTDAKTIEQSQTKVESGSKYRVRLSGIALLTTYVNRGTVDQEDVPQYAMQPTPLNSAGTFGASLRQSEISLEAFGPDFAGARTSADLHFDFAGGFPDVPNGVSMGLVRLRTGTVRLDWTNTSIVAGQDNLFFSPLSPTSLSSLAIPALSYAGNLWSWTPQIRIEHRIHLSDGSSLLLQGGILDSLSGDYPQSVYTRLPTWGEQSGQPAYASRVAWTVPVFSQDLTVGAGGYYGHQFLGFGRSVDGWAGTSDLTLPLGRFFQFTGEFYRGRAVGGLNGAIGQDVLFSSFPATSSTIVRGLDSMGGWAQLKFKPWTTFEINGAVGDDNPFASQLRSFPASQIFYGTLLSKNISPSVNFIYQARSDMLLSVEYQRFHTFVLDSAAQSANHVSLSLGYLF
jgi:hypothetical protein